MINTCSRQSSASSFFNAGTAIGVVLCVVVALVILFFVKQGHRGRQNNTSVIMTPTVTEGKRDERGVQGHGLPGADRQSAFDPMSVPNPATQVQLVPGIGPTGWPSHHLAPFPDR